jgi:hypothetical protein
MENSNDTIGNRNSDLPACSALPQPAAPPRASVQLKYTETITKLESSVYHFDASGFGRLEDACWSLVPKFAGSNPAEAVGFFRAKKYPARLPSEGK